VERPPRRSKRENIHRVRDSCTGEALSFAQDFDRANLHTRKAIQVGKQARIASIAGTSEIRSLTAG
jgi:hypothetical protein